MKILHVSDSHGLFLDFWKIYGIDPSSIDCIVHSGDFCINWSRGIRAIEEPRQEVWLMQNADRIAEWTKGINFLFVAGNHDFVDVPKILTKCGLTNIINLCKRTEENDIALVDFGGFSWYGSPYVPAFTREWNYELEPAAEKYAVEYGIGLKPDIIVSHSPIYGVLDRNGHGERCGSKEWRYQLLDSEKEGYLPKAFLHGHIHESNGMINWKSMIVSNAATTANILEIK